jgi:hypothetical protein
MSINKQLLAQLLLTAEYYTVLWYTVHNDKSVYVVWPSDTPGESFREVIVDNSPRGVAILRNEFPIPNN